MRHLVRSRPSIRLGGVALVLLVAAGGCGDGASAGPDAGALVDPENDAGNLSPVVGADGGDASTGSITPSPDCDHYLGCIAKVQPEAFPLALTTYQPNGPCWESAGAAERCSQACREALGKLSEAYPERPECGGCDPFVDPGCIDYGASCTADAQCRARTCVAYEDIYGPRGYYEIEGGLCTRRCSRDDGCPPGSICLHELHYERSNGYYPEMWFVQVSGSRCLRRCPAAPATCPPGSRCVQGQIDDDAGDQAVCLPDPL